MVNTELISKTVNSTQIQDGSITEVDIDPTSKILTSDNTKTVSGKTLDSINNILKNTSFYKYLIFRVGSTFYCKNNITGTIDSSSTVPETVIQYALDNSLRAFIAIQNGTYQLSNTFAGFIFSQNETWLVAEPGALITAQSGFTGRMWTFAENVEGCHLIGGRYSENVTIGRLWTFVYFGVTEGSLTLNVVRDVYVRFYGKLCEFNCNGTNGWINGNSLIDIFGDQFTQGIVFNQVTTQTTNNGMNRNHFQNIILQSYSGSTDGIINISGIQNEFYDCKVWDMPVGGHGVTVSSNATDTILQGGITKSAQGWVDNGVRTRVNEGKNFIVPVVTMKKDTPPTTVDANSLSLYVDTADTHLKQKDSNNSVIDITGMIGPVRGKKIGRFDATSGLSGSGIFTTFTAIGTSTGIITSTTNGDASRFTSGAVAGNSGGHRYANAYTTRAWNPYLGVRFKIGTATNNRVMVGWNNGAVPTDGNDDPLLNTSGIMLVQRSTDTTFQISNNAGTATSTFTNTGVTVDNTTVYTFEIRADAANNKFQWSLNGSAWADLTTNIPAATTYLAYMALIQTAEGVAHTIDIFANETVSDK